jgi:WD40 repeat protein
VPQFGNCRFERPDQIVRTESNHSSDLPRKPDIRSARLCVHCLASSGLASAVRAIQKSYHAPTASFDNTARIWDAASAKEIAVLRGHDNSVRSAAFNPDRSRIVTASDDKTARIWDAR